MASDLPTCRWGIVATGKISTWFVGDLVLERSNPKVNHVVQAIGSSSLEKCKKFVAEICPNAGPTLYGSYAEVYTDPNVDCVYIGTPHAFHKQNCLDAIAAGKNVLCEKAFALNAREAREVFEAAEKAGVYVAEAMWLRHRPLVRDLRNLLYNEKVIGDVFRMFSDFAMEVDIPNLPATDRYKDLKLGAGTILDIGIYSLTWAILTLDAGVPDKPEDPKILAHQTHLEGIEVTSSVILYYASSGRQGIVTSTTMADGDPEVVARIHGTNGYIEVLGSAPSSPNSFKVYPKQQIDPDPERVTSIIKPEGKLYKYPKIGRGFVYEADNTALDIAAGRKESSIMPWRETIRVMEIMDEIRRQGGTKYPQEE